ncbi:UNVERIFIED_ORG: hypothetical protein OKW15_001688 [Pseudomonas reinekei]|nr:hypothetical protein [Pseudomonas reinekei]
MSSMEKDFLKNSLEETFKVLEYLSQCEPRKAASRRTGLEIQAARFANRALLAGAVGMGRLQRCWPTGTRPNHPYPI